MLILLLIGFLAGIVTAISPCVLPVLPVLLAGGGLKSGYAHGTTDTQGMAPATEACTPDDVSATLFQCLGIDPHMELQTSTGRPVQLFREGRVIEKLLA